MTIPLLKSIKINIMLCFAFQYSNSLPSHLGNDDLCLSLQEYQLLFPHIGPLKQQFYCKHGMNVWVNMCVCVCVWEYACLKICTICFQLHIQNHFNAEDTIMYFDYMNYQKLLILLSENKILQQYKQPLKENPLDAHKYRGDIIREKALCMFSSKCAKREEEEKNAICYWRKY